MTDDADAKIAREVASRFMPGEVSIEPLGGAGSAVYRLRGAQGAHILKLARTADARALRKEHMVLALLDRYAMPVPRIEHTDLDGAMAGRPFLLLANAGDLRVADYLQVHTAQSLALCREMGELFSRIHTLVMSGSGDLQPEGYVARDPIAYRQRLDAMADQAAAHGLIAVAEADAFKSLPFPTLDGTSLCHGDFHAVQCVVRDGHIGAVVDWESAWSGNAAIDFAVTQVYLESYCPADHLAAFVAGYLSRRALPADYAHDYLPVRMAQALALARVMHQRAMTNYAARATELYRAYLESWQTGRV
jgi:Ser/Thr protein kinase RdoA (MazF antagonist)